MEQEQSKRNRAREQKQDTVLEESKAKENESDGSWKNQEFHDTKLTS